MPIFMVALQWADNVKIILNLKEILKTVKFEGFNPPRMAPMNEIRTHTRSIEIIK